MSGQENVENSSQLSNEGALCTLLFCAEFVVLIFLRAGFHGFALARFRATSVFTGLCDAWRIECEARETYEETRNYLDRNEETALAQSRLRYSKILSLFIRASCLPSSYALLTPIGSV